MFCGTGLVRFKHKNHFVKGLGLEKAGVWWFKFSNFVTSTQLENVSICWSKQVVMWSLIVAVVADVAKFFTRQHESKHIHIVSLSISSLLLPRMIKISKCNNPTFLVSGFFFFLLGTHKHTLLSMLRICEQLGTAANSCSQLK